MPPDEPSKEAAPAKVGDGPSASPVPASGGTGVSPVAPSRSRKQRLMGGLKSFGWPLFCLFQMGLIAGAFLFGSRLADPGSSNSAPEGESASSTTQARVGLEDVAHPAPHSSFEGRGRASRGELDEVDRLLRVGRYELALVLCRSFSDRAIAELRDAFQYRLGLCLEGLGHWDEALVSYRKLASHTPAARIAAVALLGQARVWLRMRRPTESKALLCDLLRRSALPELRGQSFLVDAHYLLALSASLELLPNEPPGPFNDNPVTPLTSDWSLDRALDWWKKEDGRKRPGEKPQAADRSEVVEVHPGEVVFVRLFAHQMPLTSLLDRLAEQARLHIEWSARARQQVEGRSLVVALERTSLPDCAARADRAAGADLEPPRRQAAVFQRRGDAGRAASGTALGARPAHAKRGGAGVSTSSVDAGSLSGIGRSGDGGGTSSRSVEVV